MTGSPRTLAGVGRNLLEVTAALEGGPQGRIQRGRLGVLVQLGCETDFVAKNEAFMTLARDIAMHIAATNPLVLSAEEVSHELVEKEREIWRAQLANEGKKEAMFDKILEGKEKKFREESALLKQPFVKNPEITVEQLLSEVVIKMGENIKIIRFCRFSI